MKRKLKPTEVLRHYQKITRKQSAVYLLFILLVPVILSLRVFAANGLQVTALLIASLLGLGLSSFVIQRCPVCGSLLHSRLRFFLPLECPRCHTNFANGRTP